MATARRERIMEAIKGKLDAVVGGAPSDDPYGWTWELVTRYPIDDEARRKARVVSVGDLREAKRQLTNRTEATLEVVAEFYLRIGSDESAPTLAVQAVRDLTRAVMADTTLGGLTGIVREVSNSVEVEASADRVVTGAVYFEVVYWHAQNDPAGDP